MANGGDYRVGALYVHGADHSNVATASIWQYLAIRN